ncbi:MAG: HAD family hydrolase [Bacteroidota bacterium]
MPGSALLAPCRLVAFDLDGVLVDSFECWWKLLNATRLSRGRAPLTREEYSLCWGQDVEADRRSFFPDWSVEGLTAHYNREFLQYAEWVRPMEGARETLERLRRSGKRIAVASNSPMEMVERVLELASLRPLVDWAAGADLVANGKPEPDIIEHVLHESGFRPEEACFVGDSEYDAAAARAAGVRFIGYRREGDARVESLLELVAA